MNSQYPPVIIVGAHTVGLAILRAFKDLPMSRLLVSYAKSDPARVSRYVTRLVDSPHPEEKTAQFLEELIDTIRQYPDAMVIPASDPALSVISQHKNELAQNCVIACPPYEIIRRLIDKQYTYSVAETIGIPVPRTIVPHSEEDVEKYTTLIEFPCLIKPCLSHLYFDIFHKKMVLAKNANDLMTAFREAHEHGLEVLMQEFIPGGDQNGVNYNSYRADDRTLVYFTAKKIRNAPPQLGSPCVLISKTIPEVVDMGDRLLHQFGYNGFSCMEFKRDQRDGQYKLMEINGRHNLSGLLATNTGINFPWIEYQHLMLGKLPEKYSFREGTYWIDISRDVAYNWTGRNNTRLSIQELINPYLSRHVFAIFDLFDLRPAMKRSLQLVADGLSGKRNLN